MRVKRSERRRDAQRENAAVGERAGWAEWTVACVGVLPRGESGGGVRGSVRCLLSFAGDRATGSAVATCEAPVVEVPYSLRVGYRVTC